MYHAIYGDPSLSRYGTPDSERWAMRPGFRGWGVGFGGRGAGFGSEGDKTLAGLKARGVPSVNQVNNDLEVATKP